MFIFGAVTYAADGFPDDELIEEYTEEPQQEQVLQVDSTMNITVTGQGVAPSFASSPAQAYALAKRAAMADAYRIIAERVKGVKIQGKDTIKNMAIKSSVVNTQVSAMIKNAVVVETTFQNGICEVEMEVNIDYNSF